METYWDKRTKKSLKGTVIPSKWAKYIRLHTTAEQVRGASCGPCGYHLEHIIAHGPDHPDHRVLLFFGPLDKHESRRQNPWADSSDHVRIKTAIYCHHVLFIPRCYSCYGLILQTQCLQFFESGVVNFLPWWVSLKHRIMPFGALNLNINLTIVQLFRLYYCHKVQTKARILSFLLLLSYSIQLLHGITKKVHFYIRTCCAWWRVLANCATWTEP